MVEAYVNRGYTLNDMQDAQQASQDFHTALQLAPNNGIAHLGLAFSDLQLRNAKEALDEAREAQKLMGESGATHLALATAYRQQHLLASAEQEYRTALKYAPKDLQLQLALADTLYDMRQYQKSIDALNAALADSPDDPLSMRGWPTPTRIWAIVTKPYATSPQPNVPAEINRPFCSIPATPC